MLAPAPSLSHYFQMALSYQMLALCVALLFAAASAFVVPAGMRSVQTLGVSTSAASTATDVDFEREISKMSEQAQASLKAAFDDAKAKSGAESAKAWAEFDAELKAKIQSAEKM